jgi:RHS repeat-associated protein
VVAQIPQTGSRLYYHHNHLYSVGAITNSAGVVKERYAYSAYGARQTVLDDAAIANDIGYTGRRLDQETGLWYFRARYFDAKLGRFVGRDPLEYGESLYCYYGTPNACDPTGCWPYVVTAIGGGMSSSSLWSIGFGLNIEAHGGAIAFNNVNGGCVGTYHIIDVDVNLEAGPFELPLWGFETGNGDATSIALPGDMSYAYAGAGLANAPFCTEEVEGNTSTFAISVNIASGGGASFQGKGYKGADGIGMVDGFFSGGGVTGAFAGKSTRGGSWMIKGLIRPRLRFLALPLVPRRHRHRH